MKICHIITDLDVGGAELMLKRLVEFSPDQRKNLTIISLMDFGKVGEILKNNGFTVYAIGMKSKAAFVLGLYRLYILLNKIKPDLIQTWMYHADLLGGVAGKLAGINSIVWGIHGTFMPIGRPLTKVVMKICALLSYSIPVKIVCVAELARIKHIEYGYDKSKMVVIPNGFDVDFFTNINIERENKRNNLGLLQSDILIGSVGRFHPDKGQDVLIDAAIGVVSVRPECKFVFVGRDCSPTNISLLSQIKSAGLADNILLLGERDDVPELLKCFDLYCMPSRTEAFPVALGEAMCCSLPCVATRVGDTEVLTSDTAVLVSPNDSTQLTQALCQLLDETHEFRLSLGDRAMRRVKDIFSLSYVAESYKALYQEIQSN